MNVCTTKAKKYQVELFDSAKQLPDDWDSLIPSKHFLRKEQLFVSENSNLPDLQFRYAYITNAGKPFALAYFQILNIKNYHVDGSKLSTLQRKVWKIFSGLYQPKLLVAGHLFRHDVASFFSVEDSSSFEVFKCYEETIDTVLKDTGAHAVLIKDLPDDLRTYFQHYAPQYLLLRNDISMEMQIPEEWSGLVDYEKSLKHKYAQRMRKVRKQWEKLDVGELSEEEILEKKDVIYTLYSQVSNRQQVRLGYISKEFIPALKKKFSEDFHVWMAFENDIPIAFFSAWTKEDVFDMFYIGFDYERNEELQLYFNILFFAVEQAIAYKKPKLILGRTALEAKARIGCKPVYLSTFLYIKNAMVRSRMLHMQQQISENEGEWENRHPFK